MSNLITYVLHQPANVKRDVRCEPDVAWLTLGAVIRYNCDVTDTGLRRHIRHQPASLRDTRPNPLVPYIPERPDRLAPNGVIFITRGKFPDLCINSVQICVLLAAHW